MDPTAPAVPSTTTKPWCLFRCGRTSYAVGLSAVAEVVEVERLVRLPHSPPRILGLCALRREVIPVVSLDREDDGPMTGSSSGLLMLVLRTSRGDWGVRIDAEGTAVAEEPLGTTAPPVDRPGVSLLGTVRRGETAYAVIDPEATWQSLRRGVDDWYGNPLAEAV